MERRQCERCNHLLIHYHLLMDVFSFLAPTVKRHRVCIFLERAAERVENRLTYADEIMNFSHLLANRSSFELPGRSQLSTRAGGVN